MLSSQLPSNDFDYGEKDSYSLQENSPRREYTTLSSFVTFLIISVGYAKLTWIDFFPAKYEDLD
jgi:hypothetical protein